MDDSAGSIYAEIKDKFPIVLTRDMKAGEAINYQDLMSKRPGTGISPSEIDNVIGRKAKVDISEDELLKYEYLQ